MRISQVQKLRFVGRLVVVVGALWAMAALAAPAAEQARPVLTVRTVSELFEAAANVPRYGVIEIADGHYFLPRVLHLRQSDITLRGTSGRADRVILDGARSQHGELVSLWNCTNVVLEHLTLQNVRWNGLKINSETGVQRVTVRYCTFHNIWQRAIKGVRVPESDREKLRPKDFLIEHCLFYNDRAKQFSDDPADRPDNFNGNYVGGIDVMYPRRWIIRQNIFRGIQGRTRSARGAVFLWHEAEECVVERNIIVDCDTGIALGNSHKPPDVPIHARGCLVRNNFITRAPENGIVADYTANCRIVHNSIHDPKNRLRRLIRLVHENEGLAVLNNLLDGPPPRVETKSAVRMEGNRVGAWADWFADPATGDLHLIRPLPAADPPLARLSDVPADIDGEPRPEHPTAGADEPRERRR